MSYLCLIHSDFLTRSSAIRPARATPRFIYCHPGWCRHYTSLSSGYTSDRLQLRVTHGPGITIIIPLPFADHLSTSVTITYPPLGFLVSSYASG
jgi:hypothetical protein